MCKTVLLAGLVVLCAGLMQAEEAESGDIVVAKIRLVTPHYEYEWTADAEAAEGLCWSVPSARCSTGEIFGT